jgi:predicted MFS family arabinose efflux permease
VQWGGYGLPFFTLGGFMLLTLPLNFCLLPSDEHVERKAESTGRMWRLLRIPPVLTVSLVVVVLSTAWSFMDPTLEPHLREVGSLKKLEITLTQI